MFLLTKIFFLNYTLSSFLSLFGHFLSTKTVAGFHNVKNSLVRPSSSSLLSSSASTTMLAASTNPKKHTLYDVPVSNNGARCRLILYKKQIDSSQVEIVSPTVLEGGLKGSAYTHLNPQQKMPLLTYEEGDDNHSRRVRAIPESDTIARYLLSIYEDKGPSFLPNHVTSNLLCRFHDTYISPIQGCLYKAYPPFGSFGTRSEAIQELKKQLHILDDIIKEEKDHSSSSGIYLLGSEVSLADATLFPTMIFINYMLPKFGNNNQEEILPKRIHDWFHRIQVQDADFAKVYQEV